MKTQSLIILIICLITVLISSMPDNCFASRDEPVKNQQQTLSPPAITVTINVDLTPDCEALQSCDFEILVFDVTGCAVENQPIDHQDYVYGQPNVFSNLTINNSFIRVCIRVKPGTSCGEPNYAPHCECKLAQSGNMDFDINICTQ